MGGGDEAIGSLVGPSSTPRNPRYVQNRGCGPQRPHGTGPQMARHYEGHLVIHSRCAPVPADLAGAAILGDLFPGGPGCVYQGAHQPFHHVRGKAPGSSARTWDCGCWASDMMALLSVFTSGLGRGEMTSDIVAEFPHHRDTRPHSGWSY